MSIINTLAWHTVSHVTAYSVYLEFSHHSRAMYVCMQFTRVAILLVCAHLYLCDPESKAVVSQILSFAFIVPFQLAMW